MIFVYNYGTPLTTAQATALNSFVALATTPAGNHLAKDAGGNFVNTPDSGSGGGITTLNTLTATTQTFADVDDTNVTLAINSATSTHTFTLGWTGTLAAARLNANVVQAVSNDTNVTGSISTQTLTLGWTGTLAVTRGGLGANLSSLTTNNLAKYNGTNFVDSLLASTVSGARAILAGTLTGDRTYTFPDATGVVHTSGAANNFGAFTAYFTQTDNGNSGTSDTINWGLSNKQKSTLTGNCTFTFTAPAGPSSLILECINDGTVRTITWPSTVKWAGGTGPTFTGTSGKSDIVTFFYNGTVYYGNYTLNFVNS